MVKDEILKGKKILAVDDEPDICAEIEEFLKSVPNPITTRSAVH